MTSATPTFSNLLVFGHRAPLTAIARERLLTRFETVTYLDKAEPTDEQWAAADVIYGPLASKIPSAAHVPNLKFIQLTSAGADHILASPFVKDPASKHIPIASASGVHSTSIPQHFILTTLALFHRLQEQIAATYVEKRWGGRVQLLGDKFGHRELRNQTVGFLGYGQIGRESARLAKAFGANIIAATPSGKKAPQKGFVEPGYGDPYGDLPSVWYSTEDTSSFAEFLSKSDVILLSLPSTPATIKILNSTTFTHLTSSLSDDDTTAAAKAAAGKDVAFVFITADSGEEVETVEFNFGDRNNLDAWHNGGKLVQAVAQVNNNTIVVVNTVGPIIVDAWIDNPNITALVWSGLPGQEAGNSLVDVLYGAYNPSGRLPYTVAKSEKDYSARVDYSLHLDILHIPYSEGLFIDYKHFDQANIEPRFEFGFGLSYTTFTYSGLSVTGSAAGGNPRSGYGASLDDSLHEKVITVGFTLQNNGTVAGHEIPQLYLSPPASASSPPKLLKGFDSIFLQPGQSSKVEFQISRYDLSTWNVLTQRWEIPSGNTGVLVGASSRDIRLTGSINN